MSLYPSRCSRTTTPAPRNTLINFFKSQDCTTFLHYCCLPLKSLYLPVFCIILGSIPSLVFLQFLKCLPIRGQYKQSNSHTFKGRHFFFTGRVTRMELRNEEKILLFLRCLYKQTASCSIWYHSLMNIQNFPLLLQNMQNCFSEYCVLDEMSALLGIKPSSNFIPMTRAVAKESEI